MNKKWSPRQLGFAEGYAAAMDDIQEMLAEANQGKSYDPMVIARGVINSYVYGLKDGGRQHPLADYESAAEICGYVRREVAERLNEARSEPYGAWHPSRKDKPLLSWRDNPDAEQWQRERQNYYVALDLPTKAR